MKLPKITIVTPSYNQGQFIEETIDSILSQGYPNLEYIIMDGGSTDQSVDIIKKYAHHLAYWVSEPDRGQSDAIHRGIMRSTGELCNWINSDDVLAENGLKAIAEAFIDNPDVDFIHGKNGVINKVGELTSWFPHPMEELERRYLYSMPYGQQASFFTRRIYDEIGGVNPEIRFSMDFDLYMKIHLCGESLQIDEHIGSLRQHDETKSATLENIMHLENGRVMATLFLTYNATEYLAAFKQQGFIPYDVYRSTKSLSKLQLRTAYFDFIEKYFWYYYDRGLKDKSRWMFKELIKNKRISIFSKTTWKILKDIA